MSRLLQRPYYEIKAADVGRAWVKVACPCCGTQRTLDLQSCIGRVLPQDVGKRVYEVATEDGTSTILQAENDEQRSARELAALAAEAHELADAAVNPAGYADNAALQQHRQRCRDHLEATIMQAVQDWRGAVALGPVDGRVGPAAGQVAKTYRVHEAPTTQEATT